MQFYEHNNMNGLLLTSGIAKADRPSEKAQDDNAIYGKVLFIDSKTKKVINFSKDIDFLQDYM